MPVDEILEVGIKIPGRGWLYGGLIGAAVDVTAVVAFVIWAKSENWSVLDCQGADDRDSCW